MEAKSKIKLQSSLDYDQTTNLAFKFKKMYKFDLSKHKCDDGYNCWGWLYVGRRGCVCTDGCVWVCIWGEWGAREVSRGINNFIVDHMMEPLTSRNASISSYLDTRPSPFTSSSLKIFVISLRLIRSFGDKSKSSISFLNYGKSMKLLWFSSYFLKIFYTAFPITS